MLKTKCVTSQKSDNQTMIYISLGQKIACRPDQSSKDCVPQGACRLPSIYLHIFTLLFVSHIFFLHLYSFSFCSLLT